MTRITVELPEDLAERVNAAASERGLDPSELAREALAEQFPPKQTSSIVDVGDSGGGEAIAEEHKEFGGAHFADNVASASIVNLARAVNGGTLKQEIDEAVDGDPELVV